MTSENLTLDLGPALPPAPPAAVEAASLAPRRPELTLIDASGFVFRAYHALPSLTTSKGVPTHAVLGFTRMLLKLLREQAPTHVALCFDLDSRRGRKEIDPAYKANRDAPPEDLRLQLDLIRRVADVLDVPILEVSGWEADDVIGTLAAQARREGVAVRVVTSDKDFLQIVDADVRLFDPIGERELGPEEALAKLGVPPGQVRDYLALVGDPIDNVPKVPGIGPKTAVELLQQFGDVETLLARVDEVKKPKIREAIAAHAETVRRAKALVSFKLDLPLRLDLERLARRPIKQADARALFTELEFFKLIQEMPAPPPTPLVTQPERAEEPGGLVSLAAEARGAGQLALFVAAQRDVVSGTFVAVAFVVGERIVFVPGSVLAGAPELVSVLADPAVRKVGHDLKGAWHALRTLGVDLGGIAVDLELFSYLLNPSRKAHALAELARERLGVELPEQPGEKARPPTPLRQVSVPELMAFTGACADAIARLAPQLESELEQVGLAPIARDLELPLLPVLARMEARGVLVDRGVLAEVAARVETACATHLEDVHALAGHAFNVGSPIQLAQVLFEELKLPVVKRGKTGPSTDQEVLEKLAEQHPLPRAIIEYRNVAKLKSTYLDTLPALVAADGRVHTTFHQVAAATGRLSSSDPNLQNIPIRTELGREIRRAFVAAPGSVLISADYSQIELRILAHVAGDPALVDAFAEDADVHARTAAEVFDVPLERVEPAMRRAAKMVNYGIAYGLSAHGLATRLNIPDAEAKGIIERYFARYAGIRRYLEETVEKARRSGFVETLFGRRRYMPELGSKNRSVAMAAERAAINMPIQGTAADLMKRAMLLLEARLGGAGLAGQLLLQVHDELVIEAVEEGAPEVAALAREVMESVATLKVPLRVDVGIGHSWAEIH